MVSSIDLDHAASTPLRPTVAEAMDEVRRRGVGNPSSLHRRGRAAANLLEEARYRVASALGVRAAEVHFTGGGTEAANLAVVGRAMVQLRAGRRPVVVASAVEHRAVLEGLDTVELVGGRGIVLPVDPDGGVPADALEEALATEPGLVSVMRVNNEIGSVLPLEGPARRCREMGIPFHTDAVQAAGRVPLDLDTLPVDLLSLSGHKLGGPPGTGVLVCRTGVELEPLVRGGGQERGLRGGTPDVVGAVGLATALALAVAELEDEAARLGSLRDRLEGLLGSMIPDLEVHGAGAPRAPHILHLGIPRLDGDLLVPALDLEGVAASRGSACSSGSSRPSHVVEALYGEEYARAVPPLRLSLGWSTTASEVEEAAGRIASVVGRLRDGAAAEPLARTGVAP